MRLIPVLAATAVLGALTALSVVLVRAERRQAETEAMRTALWRLEGRATALVLALPRTPRGPEGGLQASAKSADVGGFSARAPAAAPARAIFDAVQSDYGQRAMNQAAVQEAVQAGPGQEPLRFSCDDRGLSAEAGSMPIALDWPAWRATLLATIADLLPEADLVAARDGDALRLATLPVTLVPGRIPDAGGSLAPFLVLVWILGVGGLAAAIAASVAARRLAERRATFVSAVTHELRTPLTALRLHSELLADPRIAGDPARRAAPVAALQAGARRLAHLIDNVLDYARVERRAPPRPVAVPVAELAEAVRERLDGCAVDAPDGVCAMADPEAARRILANLADNARKYGRAPYAFAVVRDGRRVRCSLIDRGPGLAPAARATLFTPFTRSAEAAAGEAPGIGLGLALCKRLAIQQGGDLAVADAPGGGTIATLILPVA